VPSISAVPLSAASPRTRKPQSQTRCGLFASIGFILVISVLFTKSLNERQRLQRLSALFILIKLRHPEPLWRRISRDEKTIDNLFNPTSVSGDFSALPLLIPSLQIPYNDDPGTSFFIKYRHPEPLRRRICRDEKTLGNLPNPTSVSGDSSALPLLIPSLQIPQDDDQRTSFFIQYRHPEPLWRRICRDEMLLGNLPNPTSVSGDSSALPLLIPSLQIPTYDDMIRTV